MTGLFNAIGHETEGISAQASAGLHEDLAEVHRMLAQLENQDVFGAEQRRESVVAGLRNTAAGFRDVARNAGEYPLFAPGSPAATALETPALLDQLTNAGYRLPMSNPDLPRMASVEVDRLAGVLDTVQFQGLHRDWYAIRDILDQTERITSLGVAASRISALHGGDPDLIG